MAGRGKLTPKIIEEAAKLISIGSYARTAMHALNINPSTWYEWIKIGDRAAHKLTKNEELTPDERMKYNFTTALKKAEGMFIAQNLNLIQQAAPKNWQAAAWLLERRHPDMFSLTQRIQVTPVPQPLTVEEIQQYLKEGKAEEEKEKE